MSVMVACRHRGPAGSPLRRQRMDFLLLFSDRRRVVIEVDGRQHYADPDGHANTPSYAAMVAEDRRLQLAGYEVYRFGAKELDASAASSKMLQQFFDALIAHAAPDRRHGRKDSRTDTRSPCGNTPTQHENERGPASGSASGDPITQPN